MDLEYDVYDPTEAVLESARAALELGDVGVLHRELARMTAFNETDVNSRCPLSFQTALHLAAGAGETGVVSLLLEAGADVEVPDGLGELALHKAAEAGRRAVVRLLLLHGANVDAPRQSDGATALHLAAYTGQGDVCRLLALEGADVEARTPKGQTALHFAAISGYVHETNAVDMLVRHGGDIDALDGMGWTPMMHAVMAYQPRMLDKLLALGADVTARDVAANTALHHAMHYGHEDMVVVLLRHGADAHARNREGERAMDVLARHDNFEDDLKDGEPKWTGKQQKQLNQILAPYRYWYLAPIFPALTWFGPYFRPDFSYKLRVLEDRLVATVVGGARALVGYVRRHWHTFFGVMLLDSNNMSPYHRFTQKRLMEVEEFHDKQTFGGDFEGDVWLYDMGEREYEVLKAMSELQRAVYLRQVWRAEELLHDGYVKSVGSAKSVEADTGQVLLPSGGADDRGMLVHQGAMVDLEARDLNGSTPLLMAAAGGHREMLHLLLKYGADTEATDDKGWTALMKVAQAGHVDALNLLLSFGAAPDFANPVDKKQTALMVAAAAGSLPAVIDLVVGGADLDRPDAIGHTPLNYAFSHGHQHVVDWMRAKGATLRMVRPPSALVFGLGHPCQPPHPARLRTETVCLHAHGAWRM